MGWLDPISPPYDPLEWAKKPFAEKGRMVCESWALQGYGTPWPVYLVYLLKVVLYVGGWALFCSLSPELGRLSEVGSWWLEPLAFQKAILWSCLFEVLGFGCGSGPLTGRYFPPVGGFLYFLRPGTTKLPLLRGVPVIGGPTRTVVDVLAYAGLLALLVWALVAPAWWQAVALAVLLPALGVLDKTLFLAARSEHYWTTILVFALLPTDWIGGAKVVQAALWFFAGVSKLNHHFPAVVCVMTSNSPVTRFAWMREAMYRSYPDDLRPSRLAVWMAHGGTLLELGVPVVLLFGDGGTVTFVGLGMMLALHGFITSTVPMGVPIEWNVMVVYGGFFLFGAHADVSVLSVPGPVLALLLLLVVVVPLLGNLMPARISFLPAMRYYAGNWAYGVWLFENEEVARKLDRLTKSSPWLYDQLDRFYERSVSIGLVGKVVAFRLMHLHGRVLGAVLPQVVEEPSEREWLDGELVAGMALGWNFGDGHLHHEPLLRSIQAQCGFEEGELRCLFVESQPLLGQTLHWRAVDAKTGPIAEGEINVQTLLARQPWDWGDD